MRFSWKPDRKQKGILGGLAAVLLVAAALHVITERAFFAQASMEGAFAALHSEAGEGTVTMTGRYLPPPYGFSEKKLLTHFGKQIGLSVEGEIYETEYEGRREYVYEKQAAEAHSVLKVVYLPESDRYYLCAEVTLSGKNLPAVATFQKQIRKTAEETGLQEIATTIELCGVFEGELPLGEKDAVTDLLLTELYAQPIYENRENANYTVYAYTGVVEEYITVEKKKINVQIAFYYDREANRTEVVLASPLGLR